KPQKRSESPFRWRCSDALTRWSNDQTASVRHAARRRGGGVAARGTRAAGGNPSDWVLKPRVTGIRRLPADRPPAGFEPNRLRLRPKPGDRISLGGKPS